ncbi:MAG: hypothetical protein L0Y79_03245, partial [Chlorobi bacterium]|nr:hypothetical protein [Chlorobiota bacterium]
MKNFLLALFIISFTGNFNKFFSQDTSIVKYLPLKVGNIWVYNWSGVGNQSVKLKIVSSAQFNNHTYYYFEQFGNPCTCAQYSYSPFLIQLDNPIRIDSSTGNIFWRSTTCGWHFEESLYDSLKMTPGGFVSNSCFLVSIQDTNNILVFAIPAKSKTAGQPLPTYYKFRRYAQNFGLVYSIQGCSFSTTCRYTIKGCVLNGTVYGDTAFLVGIKQINSEIPEQFTLSQNYPNPFNPSAKINFEIPKSGFVKLVVFDVLGKEIQVLVNQELSPGTYEADFDGNNLS